MEFFVDTADIEAIRELCALLPIDGVTTNPTIITRSGKQPEQVFAELCEVLTEDQKIIAQVVATDYEGILAEAEKIASLRGGKNIVVKIPVSHEGLRAIPAVKAKGICVLATGIYSPDQAFWAAKAGADYLAPYVNRMCNYGDGVGQVIELIETLERYGMEAKVCGASFKNIDQVHQLLAAGIPSITVAPDVIRAMIDHPGTSIAVDEFTASWEKAYGRTVL
ncbi:MAG: transaldolase family protein [Coriobacteriales bacterium]|nr:transaldolase family protein [Coriobacteriales bacterium]